MAQPGDSLIVYANNQKMAIAYNARNNMAGQIPVECLNMDEPQSVADAEICMSFSNKERYRVGDLAWKAGDYIRICKWEGNYKNNGIGYNIASMEVGRFDVQMNSLKVVRSPDHLA